MVGANAKDDAKLAASKLIAESIGQLLDIRGLPVEGIKPELFDGATYGARFTFKDEGEFAIGRQVDACYTPAFNSFELRYKWPAYVDVDEREHFITPGFDPTDYAPNGSMWSEKQSSLFSRIVDRWDYSERRDLEGKVWRNVGNPNKKSPLTDVTIASKKIEKTWETYDTLYRASSFWAKDYLSKADGVKKYISKIDSILGKPKFKRSYGETVSLEYTSEKLGEICMQVSRDEQEKNSLDNISLNRDDFLKLISYVSQFGSNAK